MLESFSKLIITIINFTFSLKNLKYLSKVVLLGCLNVKDNAIKELAANLQYLENLDIGGTNITSEALRDIATLCLNIRQVNISGCK